MKYKEWYKVGKLVIGELSERKRNINCNHMLEPAVVNLRSAKQTVLTASKIVHMTDQ